MSDIFSALLHFMPELNETLPDRLQVIRTLSQSDHRIGRKALADAVSLSERTTRGIIDGLRGTGVVHVNRQGVQLTPLGQSLLDSFDSYIIQQGRQPFYEQEQALRTQLGIDACHIVPGDLENDPQVYRSLSLKTQQLIQDFMPPGPGVIAVTGGTTLSQLAHYFTEEMARDRDLTFVASRGGLGGSMDSQSNAVGALMAQRTGSDYLPLFIPEDISPELSQVLEETPGVKRVLEISQEADCILLSVGTAEVMARRRDLTSDQVDLIREDQAVGEAFGIFFDRDGRSVVRYPRIGVKIKDLERIPLPITIVGGREKSEAVKAFFKLAPSHGHLVCDEALANEILNGETQ